SFVVFADSFTRREADGDGEELEVSVPFLKSYAVFNTGQIDGLPPRYYAQTTPPNTTERIAKADRFFAHSGADIRHGGGMAYYVQAQDFIQMPAFESFRKAEAYYATLAHEMTHWTKPASRLD